LAFVAFIGVGCPFHTAVVPPPGPPSNVVAKGGDAQVTLTWTPPAGGADSYNVTRLTEANFNNPPVFNVVSPATTYIDKPLTNGTLYFYKVTTVSGGVESSPMDASATPHAAPYAVPVRNPNALPTSGRSTAFITAQALGTPRNNFTGVVGMAIRVGANPVVVKALGRIFITGNTGSHQVKIVDGATGMDIPGGAVMVNLPGSGSPANKSFVYASLASPVTLNANATYYIVTQETINMDSWYDDTTVQTTGVASVTSSVFGAGGPPFTLFTPGAHTYGPVDFIY